MCEIMKRTKLMAATLVTILCFLLAPAQTVCAIRDIKGLALAPLRTELSVSPSETISRKLQLTNYSDTQMTVRLDAEEFGVVNQQYDYSFDAQSDVSKWVSFDSPEVDIDPGKTHVVSYVVDVPQNAEPGGRYISLFASSDVQTAPGEIHTEQRIASLLYLTVRGDVTRIGSLKSLKSPVVFDGYEPWKLVVANTGTAHFRSKYTVSVRSIFDNSEVASRSGDSLVLPHTTRAISAQMPVLKYVGVYRAVYTVGLGDAPAAKREFIIYFLPKQSYVPLASLTVIVIAGISYVVWKLRQRTKMAT
ncbi:hypothetical protein KC953_00465 [Candidatus Saccharibacteria bacterium]|nr:hypothetical protein [Candidatus Saccharibacteria bacterium]